MYAIQTRVVDGQEEETNKWASESFCVTISEKGVEDTLPLTLPFPCINASPVCDGAYALAWLSHSNAIP